MVTKKEFDVAKKIFSTMGMARSTVNFKTVLLNEDGFTFFNSFSGLFVNLSTEDRNNIPPVRIECDTFQKMTKVKKFEMFSTVGKFVEFDSGLSIAIPERDADAVPEMPELNDIEHSFVMDGAEFDTMAKKVYPAISDDPTRYFMNGVLFDNKDGAVKAVTTDGRRLGVYTTNAEVSTVNDLEIFMPTVLFDIVYKIGKGTSGDVVVEAKDNQIRVRRGKIVAFITKDNGSFPNWRRVVPENQKSKIVVDKVEFQKALEEIKPFTESSTRVIIDAMNSELQVREYATERDKKGEYEVTVKRATDIPKAELEAGFNVNYLLDFFNNVDKGNCVIEYTQYNKAFTLRHEDDARFASIIMPMQLT